VSRNIARRAAVRNPEEKDAIADVRENGKNVQSRC
jgi:hypothetical protein